jgi:hypothetical protein
MGVPLSPPEPLFTVFHSVSIILRNAYNSGLFVTGT